MKTLRFAFLIALIVWATSAGNSGAQKPKTSSPSGQKNVLSLNVTHNGKHFSVNSGQRIVITLQTIGPGAYGTPRVSSPSIRFKEWHFVPPREQNPGGPRQVYSFTAAGTGEAKIEIPHSRENLTFRVTLQVKPA